MGQRHLACGLRSQAPPRRGEQHLKQKIGGEREQNDGDGAKQHEIQRILADALEHENAEAAGADQRGDGGKADRLNDDDAQTLKSAPARPAAIRPKKTIGAG